MTRTRSSSPLFSYGSLIPMPTPEEPVRRGSTRVISGLFMHLKDLLRFQIIQLRALRVDLKRYKTLRVICFVEKNGIDFGELASIALLLKRFYAGIKYILRLNLSARNTI